MGEITFDTLATVPMVRDYQAAFLHLTGVPLKLVPPDCARECGDCLCENSDGACCCLVKVASPAWKRRVSTTVHANRISIEDAKMRLAKCRGGLCALVLPLVVNGKHVASFLSGPMLLRKAGRKQIAKARRCGLGNCSQRHERAVDQAYSRATLVDKEKLEGMKNMLWIFVRQLAGYTNCCPLSTDGDEPQAVRCAKEYVMEHFADEIEMPAVARRVGMSRHYFSRRFKESAGLTFTEFVSHVRTEKARAMLADPKMRIKDVAFLSGFGSIPHFNSVFKKVVGISPRVYRESQVSCCRN